VFHRVLTCAQGDKEVFPKGLELGQALVELCLQATATSNAAQAAALRCLSGAQERLPVDLPALLAKQGCEAALPPSGAYDGRQGDTAEAEEEGGNRVWTTPTVLDVLHGAPDRNTEASAGLRQVYGAHVAPPAIQNTASALQPPASAAGGGAGVVITDLGGTTESDLQSSLLGVLDKLGMAQPAADGSSEPEKWTAWMTQLETTVNAAAALAFGAATDQVVAAVAADSQQAGEDGGAETAAARGERERAHATSSDLARLLLYAGGWADTRAAVLARSVELLTERSSGSGTSGRYEIKHSTVCAACSA
jgi:hypothetical protein